MIDLVEESHAPLISVVIAAYNAENTILEAIESVLSQPRDPSWELIVIDDGSTDSTRAVAEARVALADCAVVLNQANAGRAAALNRGVSVARGKWIVPLDADDALEPFALGRQMTFVRKHPGFGLYSWGFTSVAVDGSTLPSRHPVTDVVHEVSLEEAIRNEAPHQMGSIFIASGRLRQIGGYRDMYVEDLDLILRAMDAGARWLHNPELLHRYRILPTSKSRNAELQTAGKLELYKRLESEYAPDSVLHRVAFEVRTSLEKTVALSIFRDALDGGNWALARQAFSRAFGYLAVRPHWWLLAPLVYLAPGVLRTILERQDRLGSD